MKKKPAAPSAPQLSLFAPERPPEFEALQQLAERLPGRVRFGTSSWTFQGWKGIVYFEPYASEAAFNRTSLAEYARHPLLRSVCIDRGYYAPIPEEDLARYVASTPSDFVPIAKVFSDVVTNVFPRHPRYGARAGSRNPNFLDPVFFDELVGDRFARTFGARRAPLVLEIPPSPLDLRPFCDALDRFLADPRVARHRMSVEIRNRTLLRPRYFDVLRAHGVSHCFNYWERMPDLEVQHHAAQPFSGDATVVRLMLPPGRNYESMREAFAPFDRIVEPQPLMRTQTVALIEASLAMGRDVFVLVNNKAEGCSPRTVEALARQLDLALHPVGTPV